MYTIFCDDLLLYDPRTPDYVLTEPKLTLSANEPAQLTFNIPSSHPNKSCITKLQSRIKVYRDGTLIFCGRAIEDGKSLNQQQSFVVEGALAFLLDSMVRPFTYEGTLSGFFTQLVTGHNTQVNANQQFIVGSMTVSADTEVSLSSEDYLSTWTVLQEQLLSAYGGYLVLTFNADEQPILSWLASPPDTATQHISFGSNLRELAVTRNAGETYTACIPLGAKLKDIDENVDLEERLTIADANSGLDYLIDSTNAALYGILYAPVELTTFDEIKNATYLLQAGQSWLSNSGFRLKESISLTAVDLHNMDASIEAFSFLDRVIVDCGDICPESEFILTGMEIPLNDPASTSITLGDSRPSLVGDTASGAASAIDRIEGIESDYVTNQEAVAITNRQLTQNTSILQSAQQIILAALEDYVRTSDFESFQSTISTTLSVMAGTIEANFTETTSDISTLNGEVSQQFETIESFIRLIASGIVIGESTSSVKLKLENDILYFFTGEEDSVSTDNALAYFSAGKLYVNDVQILTSLRIGPFAFVPDEQNLNFKLMEE